jgi:hypothetical protein
VARADLGGYAHSQPPKTPYTMVKKKKCHYYALHPHASAKLKFENFQKKKKKWKFQFIRRIK